MLPVSYAPDAVSPSPNVKRSSWQIQRAVIFALLMRELKTRFGGRLVGVLWVLLEPLAHIGLVMLVRLVLRERFANLMVDAPVYLAVAMIPFFIFRNIWFKVMDSIDSNGGLFAYRQVKPSDAMAGRAILEILIYIGVFFCLFGIFAWMGYQYFPAFPLEYLGIFATFVALGAGIGVVSAVGAHALPAVRSFLRLVSFPLYMLSGVLVPITAFPLALRPYLMWNPLLHLVELSRETFFASHRVIEGINYGYPFAVTCGFMILGISLYRVRRARLLIRN